MTKPEIRVKSEGPNDEAMDVRCSEADIETMRQAMQEMRDGKGRDADVVFDELRGKLLAMKAAKRK